MWQQPGFPFPAKSAARCYRRKGVIHREVEVVNVGETRKLLATIYFPESDRTTWLLVDSVEPEEELILLIIRP